MKYLPLVGFLILTRHLSIPQTITVPNQQIASTYFSGENPSKNKIATSALDFGGSVGKLLWVSVEARSNVTQNEADRYAKLAYQVIERLPSQLSHSAKTNYWGRYVRRPLLMRLARDPELCAALQDDLIKTPTPWKRCAYPHAIARTQGLSNSAREWVVDEYNRQSSLDQSEFGYDMVTSEIRSARYSLMDALGGSLS